MEAQEFKDLLPDYVLEKLTMAQNLTVEAYIADHPDALKDVESLIALQSYSAVVPTPSPQMDRSFYASLEKEIDQESDEKNHNPSSQSKPIALNSWRKTIFQGVAAVAILLIGLLVGNTFDFGNETVIDENNAPTGRAGEFAKAETQSIEDAENETEIVRGQLVIALAGQASASKRLQAVSEVNKMNNANDQVIMALFKMLNNDPNVNVRLAAVTSLSKYVDNPKVREGLVMSITKQESPLVQIALAELMVTLKEQKSIDSMETLLKQPDINAAVKLKLEESIKRII